MTAALFVWLQYLLPHRLLGAIVRAFAHSPRKSIKVPLIGWFARTYAIDLSEAAATDLRDYATFNAFFTRELRAGARPLAAGDATLISPADGRVTQFGATRDGEALQAKGVHYSLDELLGARPVVARDVALGSYVTVYLAPHNYHRVHLPLAGALLGIRYIPGRRFSVNDTTTRRVARLFCRNERAIAWFATDAGPMAVVLVGALNVAGISTPWLGEIREREERFWDGATLAPTALSRGTEIGRFNLGSTVIVTLPLECVDWSETLTTGQSIRMGERLGSLRVRA